MEGRVQASEWAKDLELTQRVMHGDQQAFGVLYERYHLMVFRLCLKYLKNEADAEDVSQEIWGRAYKKASQFKGQSLFKTWLMSISIKQILMAVRPESKKHFVLMSDLGDEKLEQETFQKALEEEEGEKKAIRQIDLARDHAKLVRAIESLPAHQRLVFVLRYIEGNSSQETAEMLGESEPAVKTRTYRARHAVRKKFLFLMKFS